MAKTPKAPKLIEHYAHTDKERANNPHVGLVNDRTDTEYGQHKKQYRYDPHLDPELTWDPSTAHDEALERFAGLKQKLHEHGEAIAALDKLYAGEAADQVAVLKQQHADLLELLKETEAVHKPALKWTGKAEHTTFEVPTVNLHVHERIDPKTIIESVKRAAPIDYQPSLFEERKPYREAIEFYKHKEGWANRLIAGDSLLVMNSLLEKEGMGGKVQMVYFDPPYGIKYGSNFQPFVNKRDVKDGNDDDLTQEPEMIKAFRDTWEMGIHSYLTYLRDRLLLARELLHDSGSIFVQISDENLHHLREILDELFGAENFVSLITYSTTSGFSSKTLSRACDYILWYAKKADLIKYTEVYSYKENPIGKSDSKYDQIEFPSGERRGMTKEEKDGTTEIPKNARIFRYDNIVSTGSGGVEKRYFKYQDKVFDCGANNHWKASIPDGMSNLAAKNRLSITSQGKLAYVRYFDDFPLVRQNNIWSDIGGAVQSRSDSKVYVVQTGIAIIERCVLMSTEPGDLILDITCGSGTTARVAEDFGRRWITCDTSRVAITLAKQRLMCANFDYYQLAYPEQGVGSGFKYKTVPHITLKSIANNEPPGEETLYDQPLIDRKKTRVTGPFTVESIPAPMVRSLDEPGQPQVADNSISRSGETLRQQQWRDELLRTGVRAKGGTKMNFSSVNTLEGTRHIQAVAETKEENPQQVLIVFGPEHAPMEQRQVEKAINEARQIKPDILLFCAFQFDPEAAKDVDDTNEKLVGFKLLRSEMNMDLLVHDLKKKRTSDDSFWLIGQPDVTLTPLTEGPDTGKYVVEVNGFDYFDPKTGNVKPGGKKNIAMWMLDTDYDGRSIFPRQVFLPLAGTTDGWAKLAKNLKAEIDEDKIEAFNGTVSLPFTPGDEVAVKIVDDRGIESLRILRP